MEKCTVVVLLQDTYQHTNIMANEVCTITKDILGKYVHYTRVKHNSVLPVFL
jgi:hypothetical protein